MAAYPKIIEFYGLPGCGKTTLRNYIQKSVLDKSFCLISDVSAIYRSRSIFHRISHLPLKAWWQLLLFLISCPMLSIKEWGIYGAFFKIVLAYSYRKYITGFDYMLVDHGLMQNTVGLLYGHAEDLQPKAYRHLEKLVLCVSPDFLIYYDIPVELALERIRIRNRKNSGRLDSESDDNIVKKNLLLLDRLFKRASGLISLWGEFYHIKYDHEYTTKQICENLKLNEIWSQKQF